VTSRTLRLEPPHRLVFTWSYPGRETDEIEIRLGADGKQTLLELEQRSYDQTEWWFGAGARWESALLRLGVTTFCGGESPLSIHPWCVARNPVVVAVLATR